MSIFRIPTGRVFLAAVLLFTVTSFGTAEASSLRVFWTRPIPASSPVQSEKPQSSAAPILTDIIRGTGGQSLLLGRIQQTSVLVQEPDALGLGSVKSLSLKGAPSRLLQADSNTILIGGSSNARMYFPGAYLSDAYLARLDPRGQVLAEHTFGGKSHRYIQDMAFLPSGDIIAVGRDNRATWLARISNKGTVQWERTFGSDKGAAVATLNSQILVAGFERKWP